MHAISILRLVFFDLILHTVAVKRYFESQVHKSKEVSPEEVKKKRMLARRNKVNLPVTYVHNLLFSCSDEIVFIVISYDRLLYSIPHLYLHIIYSSLTCRRSKHLRSKERTLWAQMNSLYMSDEETDSENEGGFVVRKLEWRSTLLNKLVAKLDDRYKKSRQENTNKRKVRAPRRTGSPSLRRIPCNAPKWTLSNGIGSASTTSTPPHSPDIPTYNTPPSPSHTSPSQPNSTVPSNSSNPSHTSTCFTTTTPLSSGLLTASARMLSYSEELRGAPSDSESIDDDPELDEMIRSTTCI